MSNSLRQPLLATADEHANLNSPRDRNDNVATVPDEEQPPSYDDRLLHTEHMGDELNDNELRRRRGSARILDRDAAFYQSRGRWSIRHVSRSQARLVHTPQGDPRRLALTKQFWNDWFHTLAYQKTYLLVLILFFLYAAIIFVFAFIYLFVSLSGETTKVDPDDGSTKTELFCDMDIHDHMEALYFSLSTMTTIGYGVSDYYFGGCWTPLLLVLMQVCCALIFDAVAIGLIFQRISRGHKRSKTILFSDKAAIRRVRGVPHLYIRLAELRHHQLLEATVRAYCVRHERNVEADGTVETTHFVTKPMKLVHEEMGSHIMMSLPQVLVHRMDDESPLVSTGSWYDASGQQHAGFAGRSGEEEENKELPTLEEKNRKFVQEMKDIKSFLEDRETEIVLLLEGTDELTGAVIQARHSYTIDELVWNHRFASCTYPYSAYLEGGTAPPRLLRRRRNRRDHPRCAVDFALFHETVPAPLDSESCPYT